MSIRANVRTFWSDSKRYLIKVFGMDSHVPIAYELPYLGHFVTCSVSSAVTGHQYKCLYRDSGCSRSPTTYKFSIKLLSIGIQQPLGT